jgi:hypothetical protein
MQCALIELFSEFDKRQAERAVRKKWQDAEYELEKVLKERDQLNAENDKLKEDHACEVDELRNEIDKINNELEISENYTKLACQQAFKRLAGWRKDRTELNTSKLQNAILRERIKNLRKAALAFNTTWFEPNADSGVCILCDLHCSQPHLGHAPNCPGLIAHTILSEDDKYETET